LRPNAYFEDLIFMTPELNHTAANHAYALGMEAQALIASGDDCVYFDLHFVIEPSIKDVAAFKNVPIEPTMYLSAAAKALDCLSQGELDALSAMKPEAVTHFQMVLSRTLDLFAAVQTGYIVVGMLGKEPPAPDVMMAVAEQWLDADTDDANRKVKIWPDLFEAAQQHIKALVVSEGCHG
jgi:hypothetical protein